MWVLWWGVVVTMPIRMTWGGYEVEKQLCGSCATLDKGEAVMSSLTWTGLIDTQNSVARKSRVGRL